MVTVADLAAYVGAAPTEPALPALLAAAVGLVDGYLKTDEYGEPCATIPAAVKDNAYLQVGSELYARRNAPGGIVTYGGADAGGMRLSRDPMASVRAELAPYRALVVG